MYLEPARLHRQPPASNGGQTFRKHVSFGWEDVLQAETGIASARDGLKEAPNYISSVCEGVKEAATRQQTARKVAENCPGEVTNCKESCLGLSWRGYKLQGKLLRIVLERLQTARQVA